MRVSIEEFRLRIDFTTALVEKGWPPWRIKREVRKHWKVHPLTVQRYISIARGRLLQATKIDKPTWIANVLVDMLKVRNKDGVQDSTRLKANMAIAKLLGLNRPQELRVEVEPARVAGEVLEFLEQAGRTIEEGKGASPPGPLEEEAVEKLANASKSKNGRIR